MRIELEDVWLLECTMKRIALHVDTVWQERFDHRGLCLGTWRPDEPMAFKHDTGSRAYDVISATYAAIELISDRMVETLQGFSGWSTFPATVTGKRGEEVPGYSGLVITGRCGPLNKDRGRELWGPHETPPGKPGPRRLFPWFDPDTWDGSDLFAPEGTAHRLITRDLMLALKRAKITNITMTPLCEA